MDAKLLDKFYTKTDTALRCVKSLFKLLPKLGYSKAAFLEPSVGGGSFLLALEKMKTKRKRPKVDKIFSYDIDPNSAAEKNLDFLEAQAEELGVSEVKGLVTLGNPPFGRRSRKAVAFVNKAAQLADTIAFIVPLQFKKWSVQKRLAPELKLVYDEELEPVSFEYENGEVAIRTCFQIWTRRETKLKDLRLKKSPPVSHPDFVMYLHNNTKQTLKFFDKEEYGWNFAVPRQGYYDYNMRVEDAAQLRENVQWMFFKSEEEDVLRRIDSIDFEKLSCLNTTIPGYGKADVVMEYKKLYEEEEDA